MDMERRNQPDALLHKSIHIVLDTVIFEKKIKISSILNRILDRIYNILRNCNNKKNIVVTIAGKLLLHIQVEYYCMVNGNKGVGKIQLTVCLFTA